MSNTQTTGNTSLPTSDFVMLAARIAQVAAGWAADAMALPEDLSRAMDHLTIERFAHDIRTRVSRIVERANGD